MCRADAALARAARTAIFPIMKKRTVILSLALVLAAAPAAAQKAQLIGNFGDWSAFSETEDGKPLCYTGSEPTKAEGNYTSRGDPHVLVTHRPAEKAMGVISIAAGYTHKDKSEVTAEIGDSTFRLFTDGGHAFAFDAKGDAELVKAMERGTTMVVKGTSSRGTPTTDAYSLKGFTAAYAAISKACGAN